MRCGEDRFVVEPGDYVWLPPTEPRPDPRSLDYEAMNAVAAETGQPVLGPPMSEEEAAAIAAV